MSVESRKPPLVSIVVNNYNYGRFLRAAIESSLNQTYSHTEIIVVDDGSTDYSRDIIASYGGLIKPVLKKNGGQASAFNAGFATSRGEIVIFLDADDILLPNAADEVVKVWRPELAKVQYLLEVVDSSGMSMGVSIPSGHMPDGDLRDHILTHGAYVSSPTSGNAFARELLKRLLPMPEREWRISADGYLLHLSPFYGEFVSLHKVLGCYRVHTTNNYAMDALNLHKLRSILSHDMQKQDLLRELGEKTGFKVDRNLVVRIPSHVKVRLASLRLSPDDHPFKIDNRFKLAVQGIEACCRAPDFSLSKKIFFSAWFVLTALLPKRLVRPLVSLGMMPQERPLFLQRLSA